MMADPRHDHDTAPALCAACADGGAANPDGIPSRAVGVSLLVLTAVLWSFGGLAVKTAGMHPVAFALLRSVAACIGMALLVPLGAGCRPPWRWLALSSALYTGTITLLIIAMTRGTAASGILLQNTAPVFCAIFAWAFQRQRVAGRTVLAICIGVAGIVIMLASSPRHQGIVPPLCGLASGICYAALIMVLQHMDSGGERINPFHVVMCNNAGAVAILLPLWLATGAALPDMRQLAIVTAAGLFQVGLPYVTFQISLRRVHAVDASLLVLLEPVLNPAWVALAGIEVPPPGTWAGGAAILAALIIDATKTRSDAAPR